LFLKNEECTPTPGGDDDGELEADEGTEGASGLTMPDERSEVWRGAATLAKRALALCVGDLQRSLSH